MPFREAPADFPPADGEDLAVKVLAERAARLRRSILLPGIFGGLVAMILGYMLVRELQFAAFNAQIPWLSGALGGVPPFLASLRLTQMLGNIAVRKRAPAWID